MVTTDGTHWRGRPRWSLRICDAQPTHSIQPIHSTQRQLWLAIRATAEGGRWAKVAGVFFFGHFMAEVLRSKTVWVVEG